jgi:hypothetical protein
MAITEANVSEWLNSVRVNLHMYELLVCPSCSRAIGPDDLKSNVCSDCQKSFLDKGWSHGMRKFLWVVLAVLGAVAGISLIIGMFSSVISTTWPANTPPLMRLIPILGCFVGIAVIFGIYMFFVTHFSPKPDSPQRTLSRLAKQYFKSGDLHRAARLYAELLTFGYSDNFFTDTGRAFECWQKLGTNVQDLKSREPFRDLLFWERLVRHAQQREFGDREHADPALGYLKDLVSLADENDNLIRLGEIYRGFRSVSRVPKALRGNILTTNSVSSEEMSVKESNLPETLKGKRFPRLAAAFEAGGR